MKNFGKLILHKAEAPDQEFLLNKSLVTLGRSTTNDIVLMEGRVSRQHAQIECSEGEVTVTDLQSANGVWLNGEKVLESKILPGDRILISGYVLEYLVPTEESGEEATVINTEDELDETMMQLAMPVTLNDTTQPRLAILAPDRTWEILLDQDTVTIGRNSDNHLIVDYLKISRNHARIDRHGDQFVLKDLQSTNGTTIDGSRIDTHILQNGDTFQIGPTRMVYKSGFSDEEMTLAASLDLGKQTGLRPVVFVPGLMGSEMYLGSERVWPNFKLLIENPALMRYSEDSQIKPKGILQEVVIVPNLISMDQYNLLGNYLIEELGYERGNNFMEFAYDWRQDVRRSAGELAAAIDAWKVDGPVTIIAHSLGTLVSRFYIEKLGGKRRVNRLMLMGGPHQGVPKIAANLLTGVDMLPFGLMGKRMTEVIESFPTVYQILPVYDCGVDQNGKAINFLEDDSWVKPAYRPLHRLAGEFRRELGYTASVTTLSIFGYGLKTISKLRIRRDSNGIFRHVDIEMAPAGDDTIPESSGMLGKTEIHPVQQNHGTLFNDKDVKMRLRLELLKRV